MIASFILNGMGIISAEIADFIPIAIYPIVAIAMVDIHSASIFRQLPKQEAKASKQPMDLNYSKQFCIYESD